MKNRRYREVAKRSLAICLLAALLLAGTAVGEVSREGLVAEWHFDEGTGNIVKDSSGNGNNGIIYGATYVNGVSGNALIFDGVDDYVEFSYDTDFTPGSNSWTIEAWVKIDSSKDIDIISWFRCGANPNCNTGDDAMYELFINNDGKAGWTVRDDNGNSYQITSPSPITDNKWHFLTAAFSSSSDYMKLYVDGKLSNEKSATLTTLSAGTIQIPLEIGRVYRKGWAPSGSYFNGIIDEVRIYNRELSSEEVKQKYEQGSNTLSLTKSASPQSIKQGQTTTITLTVKNTGSTEISDIQISDVISKDITIIDGETKKTYTSLSPQESRQFQYSAQINEAGTFNLGEATATYADNNGNYYTNKSNPASIKVIPYIFETTVTPPKPPDRNASVSLHGEKTDVVIGEDIVLKLSVVKYITKPVMTVQVILIPPSGMSVTSSEFVDSGGGQFTSTFNISTGDQRDIEVRIKTNQAGDFEVMGTVIYYFGNDQSTAEHITLNLPIKVRKEITPTPTPKPSENPISGFGAVSGAIAVLFAILLLRRR